MEVDDVCEKLDQTLLDFFDILGQIYQEQAKLEQYMRDGYLNLSRARYSMGVKSVSALQLPEKEMTPLLTVGVGNEKTNAKFEFQKVNGKVQKKSNKGDEVRKRKVEKDAEDDADVETIGRSDEGTKIENCDNDDVPSIVDPIKWFGVLVPQALRRSQSSFQEAVGLAVTVANLKQRLETVRKDYKILMNKKTELTSDQAQEK